MKFFPGLILAIETSCDETSAAVLRGLDILSSVVSSQEELHRQWGGIVPEAAARVHIEAVLPVLTRALVSASVSLSEVQAIAVTNRPGLVGALSVGVTAAQALALALRLPLFPVHHLEGHLWSILATTKQPELPTVSLIASGGHTEIVYVTSYGNYRMLGQTRDDAAGEAFDKAARVLGLGYPGGKAIQAAAEGGVRGRYLLPKGLTGDTIDFSFSGLKTAVMRLVETEGSSLSVPDAALAVQESIVGVLSERAVRAADQTGAASLSLVGGVAANRALRSRMAEECRRRSLALYCPPIEYCTDNAAMIGLAASLALGSEIPSHYVVDVLASSDL